MAEWISTKDRMPEKDVLVLAPYFLFEAKIIILSYDLSYDGECAWR